MTQEVFDEIVDMFEKRNSILDTKGSEIHSHENQLEMLKMGVDLNYKSPYMWMIKWFKFDKEIISKFDSINEGWCEKYHNDRNNFPNESTKLPLIFCDFKNYVEKLKKEKYEDCEEIKKNIFKNY